MRCMSACTSSRNLALFGKRAHGARCATRSEAPGAVLHRKVLSRANFSIGSGVGGARRDRTDDLLLAKQALSQLSYGPRLRSQEASAGKPAESAGLPIVAAERRRLVGLGRLELPTSRLSSARSNQLSYKPKTITVIRPAGIPSRTDENTARARP